MLIDQIVQVSGVVIRVQAVHSIVGSVSLLLFELDLRLAVNEVLLRLQRLDVRLQVFLPCWIFQLQLRFVAAGVKRN